MAWIFNKKDIVISKTTDGKFEKKEKTTDMTGEETVSSMYDQCCKMTDQEPKEGLSTSEKASECMDMMSYATEKKTKDEELKKKKEVEIEKKDEDEEPKKDDDKETSKTKDSYNFDEMKIMIAGMPTGPAKDSMSEAIRVAQGVKKDDNFVDLSNVGKTKDTKATEVMSNTDFRDLITGKK